MRDFRTRNLVLSILGLVLFATTGSAQAAQEGRGTRGEKAIREPFESQSSGETKEQFDQLLSEWYPPTLRMVLQLDPSLLSSPSYLENYPKLAEFLDSHPEVVHNPGYFVGNSTYPFRVDTGIRVDGRRSGPDLEPMAAAMAFLGFVWLAVWLLRSIMAHRRWLRTSRLQTEAQAKILERFSANEDLLNFIQTPAGRRFLDFSSTPLEPRSLGAPVGRILFSVQAGLVLLCAGLGMEVLGRSAALDPTEGGVVFLVFGGIIMALGVGFLVSGLASYILSKRLGLFDPVEANGLAESSPPRTPST